MRVTIVERPGARIAVIGLLLATPAAAQPLIVADSGDSGWVLAAAMIALATVIPGLALTYAHGASRRGVSAFATALCASTLLFIAIGYSIAFSPGSPFLGSVGNAFLANLAQLRDGTTVAESVYVFAQLAPMLLAVGIIASSVTDRARPGWLVPFAALWMLVVYVPVARWTDSGWLATAGALDYAGGIAVHLTGGMGALVVGLLVRRRQSDPLANEGAASLPGPFLLGVGMIALSGIAPLGAGDDAAGAMLSSILAATSGVVVAALFDLRPRQDDARMPVATLGGISGLAAIAAGAGIVGPLGAMLTGAIGAICALSVLNLVSRDWRSYAVDAFGVHAIAAGIGAIVFPVFIFPGFGGPGFADGTDVVGQVGAQTLAVASVAGWAAATSAVIALSVSVVFPMRARRRAGASGAD